MSPPNAGRAPPKVELYVRSLAPRAGRDLVQQTVRRLDSLAAEGTVDDVSIRVTGDALPASPGDCVTSDGAALVSRLVQFRDWATRTGRELSPGFDHRSVHSLFTGQDYDAVVLPALCLAEYGDGRLQFVSPCLDHGTPITVEQRLAELERIQADRQSDASTGTPRPPEELTGP